MWLEAGVGKAKPADGEKVACTISVGVAALLTDNGSAYVGHLLDKSAVPTAGTETADPLELSTSSPMRR